MEKRLILWLMALLSVIGVQAQDNANSRQARKMFEEVLQKITGPQGSTMHYNVNIASLYKTEGTIWYKGKKSKYLSKNSRAWNDGEVAYVIKGDRKEVEIYHANSPKQSRFGDTFKLEPNNYTYNIVADPRGYLITLKAKKGAGVKGMKEIRALLDKKTHNPLQLRIKVAFVWANVEVSDFKSGGISDDTFTFPRHLYKDYEIIDKRD
ncbi:MAG: hypothetical protein J6M19_05325 [Bacteroidaceae bacterium]|nr:hypothetical protein [Bacteroidaceae bacterium]